ncbi:MAG: hypothetical protein QM808_10760 [Steroidobacteraceae bacterium]
MHARYQELVSLRDGEPLDAGVVQHVADCMECSAELAKLNDVRAQLQRLPDFTPAPRAWLRINARLLRPQQPRHLWLPWSVAASLLVMLSLWWPQSLRPPTQPRAALPTTQTMQADDLQMLVARSQQLEALLLRMPARPAVERVATSATIAALQDRIEMLDLELSVAQEETNRAHKQQLWSERVRLLDSLVGVRYAEATRAGYQLANNDGAI